MIRFTINVIASCIGGWWITPDDVPGEWRQVVIALFIFLYLIVFMLQDLISQKDKR